MEVDRLSDDETVYRRIPRADAWFEEPNRITTANFKLDRRRGELGVSVYRAAIVSPTQVLAMPGAIPGSLIARTTVGAVRAARNGKGEPLNLDVVVVDDEQNPGHAEIRGSEPGKLTQATAHALRDIFSIMP